MLVHNFSGGSISINSMHLNETFCVTGSDDGYLRLWPLDFAYVYLEAGMSTMSVAIVSFSKAGICNFSFQIKSITSQLD